MTLELPMDFFPTIYFTLIFGVTWLTLQANGRQVLLQNNFNISSNPIEEPVSWNFSEKPSRDSTNHLIFDTVNTFLQHWPNTRYRNGHNIVAGTIPMGTIVYHSTDKEEIPRSPEWTATDPEHSYLFCFNMQENPCWHLTMVATRPLKVLYFDGNSAAKFPGGSMDSQDVLIWGETKPDWLDEECKRLDDLCQWGKQYGIDGFVRMEMDFEVMLCDFSAGVEVVSFHHLVTTNRPEPKRPGLIQEGENMDNTSSPIQFPTEFRVIESGSWHNRYPGETRIHLNYAGIVSFYDTALFPSLIPLRYEKERWDHRLEGISSEDVGTLLKTLGGILNSAWDRPVSGIDWKTFLRVVVDRYADRLQVLNRFLDPTVLESEDDVIVALKRAHKHMSGMLAPYRLFSASPPTNIYSTPNLSWATPVFKECATTHTRYFDSNPSLFQNLTYSERLLLDSTKSVSKEICRVIVGMWAEGVGHTVSEEGFTHSARGLMTRWKKLTEDLMAWLDWSEWITCRPACGDEEICYLPTWPYFRGGASAEDTPLPSPSRFHHFNWFLRRSRDDDSVKPQPRCLRRVDLDPVSA